jgi:hypothetical protein
MHLTQNFLARKEQEYIALKIEIASLRQELQSRLDDQAVSREAR